MMIAIFSILLLVAGLIMWRPSVAAAGQVMFVVGLAITAWVLRTWMIHIG